MTQKATQKSSEQKQCWKSPYHVILNTDDMNEWTNELRQRRCGKHDKGVRDEDDEPEVANSSYMQNILK